MTTLKPDAEVLTSKIDEMREDVRRLLPILSLLEPPEHDNTTSFAERILAFMHNIEANYSAQTAEFTALRRELGETTEQMKRQGQQLEFLIKGAQIRDI